MSMNIHIQTNSENIQQMSLGKYLKNRISKEENQT